MCNIGDSGVVCIARSVSETQFLHSLVGTQEKGKVITESKYIFAAAAARQKSHLCTEWLTASGWSPSGWSCKLQLDLSVFQLLNLATWLLRVDFTGNNRIVKWYFLSPVSLNKE